MSSQRARSLGAWERAALGALVAVLPLLVVLGLASGGPASGASATEGSTFGLLEQSPAVVQPDAAGEGTLTLDLSLGVAVPAGAQVELSLYRALGSRSAFQATLSGAPFDQIDRSTPVPVSGLATVGTTAGPAAQLSVTVAPGEAPGGTTTPTLSLGCTLGNGSCPGVYPLVVSLERSGGGTLSHFTTYLTFAEGSAAAPLRFAWVVPFAAPVRLARTTDLDRAMVPPSNASVSALDGLAAALGAHPDVAVTVAASPATVQALSASASKAAQGAVAELRALSADQQLHQFPAQPYVGIDLSAIAGGGESTEISAQMVKGAGVLRAARIATDTSSATWVAQGTVGPSLGTGLAEVRADRVVVPDDQLAAPDPSVSDQPGYHTWTYPFTLPLGRGTSVEAAASDGEISAEFTDDAGDPALEAVQVLADLAVIHFEAPNLTDDQGQPVVRGVVAVPPAGWTPSVAFDDQLLSGLSGNPDVSPVTLDGYFSSVPPGGPQGVTTRHLASSASTALPVSLARQLTRARLRLTSFVSAVRPRSLVVLSQLDDLLLAAESDGLRRAQQFAGVAEFERALGGQLSLIKVATERTITLTSRTAAVPITILSTAHYTVVARMTVTSDRFLFPGSGGTVPRVVIDHPTTPEQVQVVARTTGDLPLSVTLAAPQGTPPLVIAHGQMTVRSTATSIVGVVLTVAAAAVLLFWWARTWRAGRRARRARAPS